MNVKFSTCEIDFLVETCFLEIKNIIGEFIQKNSVIAELIIVSLIKLTYCNPKDN